MGKTNNYQLAGDLTFTTTGNIDDLDIKGYSLIRMDNASLSTIRGLRAGYPGQVVSFVSVGAGQVNFAHQNVNSVAANRLINYVTSGITPLAAGSGTATYQYDSDTARWRLINHEQGAIIDVAFDSANFTSNVGSWTVDLADQVAFNYRLIGKSFLVNYNIQGTDVGTAGGYLYIAIPNGYTIGGGGTLTALIRAVDAAAVAQLAYVRAVAGATTIENRSSIGAIQTFAATTSDNTSVTGSIEFPVT